MRKLTTIVLLMTATALGAQALAQQDKTHNSGASGYVGDQEKPGAAAQPPGQPNKPSNANGDVTKATSAQNSGAGISGAPGNKNGPAERQGTVGSSTDNSVQQQDPANVQGLPGNKSGPAVKR